MLTPDDMQKKIFALGKKIENTDVGMFVKELQINYQFLYNELAEKTKQVKGMEAKLQYYRKIESSLQEAMVSAEKVSEDKIALSDLKEFLYRISQKTSVKASFLIGLGADNQDDALINTLPLNQYNLSSK